MKKFLHRFYVRTLQLIMLLCLYLFTLWRQAGEPVSVRDAFRASTVVHTICSGINGYFGFFYDAMQTPQMQRLFGFDEMDDSSRQLSDSLMQSGSEAVYRLESSVTSNSNERNAD